MKKILKKKRRGLKCQRKVGEEICCGNLEIIIESEIPIFVCSHCGFRNYIWKKFYSEYLELYKMEQNWNSEKDKVSCILGLFCHLYKEKYNVPYTFIPSSPNPFSLKESLDARKLLAFFNNNGLEARKYLIWAFKRGIGQNTELVSLAYLNTPNLIRKFKLWLESSNILTRDSKLPDNFLKWCQDNAKEIFNNYTLETMNDLGAILNFINNGSAKIEVEKLIIKKASEIGLIKDNKLNIGK